MPNAPPVIIEKYIISHFFSDFKIRKHIKKITENINNSDVVEEDYAEDELKIVKQIKVLLDEKIKPAVAQDGGDITFQSFEEGVVYLHMQGACAGCPSSTMTLKMGIENLLKHYIPEVTEVRPVAI